MRTTLISAVALTTVLATGCATVDSDLQHRGTLSGTPTDGVVLFEDGESGHAAMFSTTCVVDPDGGIAEDVDPSESESETVTDSSSTLEGESVLARTQGELHVIENNSVSGPISVPGLVDARFTHDGDTIAAVTDCGVSWIDRASGMIDSSMSLADMDCEGMGTELDVDAMGTAYIDLAGSIHAVTPDSIAQLTEGDLFAYSGDELGLVTAVAGQDMVRFVEADGTERWSTDLGGPVSDVEDLGARGWVGVMVQRGELGEFVVLDASTGLEVKSFDLPSVADMVVSGNGQTIAMVLPDNVHYYTLH